MLEVLRRSQRWLMGGVIFVVGGVFVAYLGLGGPGPAALPGGDAIVQLDGRRYTLIDLQRVRDDQERRLRESLGDAYDAESAGLYLDQMAAESLIQRAVLAAEAERLGLRATDDEVRDVVRSVFRTDAGAIDAAAARNFGESRYGSERRFAAEIRDDILTSKLLQLIDAGVQVSDAEVRDALRYRREAVRLALVVVDPAQIPEELVIEDDAIETLLAEDSPRVRAFYDEHVDRYRQPEKVRARHVLLRVAPDAGEEDVERVREQAVAVRERILAGEEFAKVAEEVSEDPGSKVQGGDLGFFARGQMVPAFEEVAFSLEPGATSDIVKTDFGFHVIRVEERQDAEERSFDEAAHEIAKELLRAERGAMLAKRRTDALVEAIRGGRSLVDAARELNLDIQRPDWISRRPDGFLPGVGASPELLTEAFTLTADQPTSTRVFEIDDKRVMVELLERRGPTSEELATELPGERDQLLERLRTEARNTWLTAARDRFLQEGRLRVDLTMLPPAASQAG
ncbi:peptidylprolyl isomerase [Myxococcota bacterium]|nr:peptidylprolyl isomerase [Myxococcota bacterium]MCZ7620111.1 peptidylprolyl isomerase [Myxococcota bacterium]